MLEYPGDHPCGGGNGGQGELHVSVIRSSGRQAKPPSLPGTIMARGGRRVGRTKRNRGRRRCDNCQVYHQVPRLSRAPGKAASTSVTSVYGLGHTRVTEPNARKYADLADASAIDAL